MSFRIPTLEEARKKQEASLSINKYDKLPSFKSQKTSKTQTIVSNTHPAPSSTVTKSTGYKNQSNNPYNASQSKVVNPYLKHKKNKSIKSPVVGNQNTPKFTQHTRTDNSSQNKSYCDPNNHTKVKATPLHLLNDPNAKTFSQAFKSIDYVSDAKNKDDKKMKQKVDEEEQRALDASMIISQLEREQRSTEIHLQSKTKMARDNHAMLQPHILHVSTKQRGNRIIQYIRNVPYEFSKMVPDYIMGSNRCALFLSCKYHKLHPSYVHRRIAELQTDFELRVLLTLVDIEDNANTLLFLNQLCVLNHMTLILAWSDEEAARYLETFKAFEKKDAKLIQRREKETHTDQVADVLASIRSINKTDSQQLMAQFGCFTNVIQAPMDELSFCSGIGPKKVKRLFDAFNKPFSRVSAAKKSKILIANTKGNTEINKEE